MDPHVKDWTVSRPSYLYHGNLHTRERRSLYWDGALEFSCYTVYGMDTGSHPFNNLEAVGRPWIQWCVCWSYHILIITLIIYSFVNLEAISSHMIPIPYIYTAPVHQTMEPMMTSGKRFLYCCPFAKGIHLSPVSPHKGSVCGCNFFLVIRLNKLWNCQ